MAATVFLPHTLCLQCGFDILPIESWGARSLPLNVGTLKTITEVTLHDF